MRHQIYTGRIRKENLIGERPNFKIEILKLLQLLLFATPGLHTTYNMEMCNTITIYKRCTLKRSQCISKIRKACNCLRPLILLGQRNFVLGPTRFWIAQIQTLSKLGQIRSSSSSSLFFSIYILQHYILLSNFNSTSWANRQKSLSEKTKQFKE